MKKKVFICVAAVVVILTCMLSVSAQETAPPAKAADASKPEPAATAPPAQATGAPNQDPAKTESPEQGPGMGGLIGTTSGTTQPQPVEAAFTNADVIKLTSAGMSNDVVISKINNAKKVDFKVDTDDLIALKNAGVNQDVISAMVNRSSSPSAPQGGGAAGGSANRPIGSMSNAGTDDMLVRLVSKEGTKDLSSIAGTMGSTYAFFTVLFFMDYPGLRAETRIKDRKPHILVESRKNPQGRIFLVHCEVNSDDNNRSVKMGKSGMYSSSGFGAPDTDDEWTVQVDLKQLEPGLWRIDPKKELKPGEYGVWGPASELFDFAVDK